jgi:DNA-binding Xre family transcriptional regulator
MALSYNKLWKLLIDRNMKKTELRLQADIGTSTLAKLGKGQPVSMEVMMRICGVLKCDISDVMEIIPSKEGAAE